MFKATIQASGKNVTLRLQGRLAGAAIKQLAGLWNRILTARLHKDLRIDSTSLSHLDSEGERLLRKIQESGRSVDADNAV